GVPGTAFGYRLVNFDGGPAIPTYSLADLLACAEAGDRDFFQRSFAGRTVIIGTVLDVDDRRLTSGRWISAPDRAAIAARCRLPVMTKLYEHQLSRDTIPGVYVQAQAVNDLLRREVPRTPSRLGNGAILLGLCAVVSLTTASQSLFLASLILVLESV